MNDAERLQQQVGIAAVPTPSAAAVYVSYRTPALDLRWIPDDVEVIVVHNDDSLRAETVTHPQVRYLWSSENVGFGAAVNRALAATGSSRIVICNPDTTLTREHWNALAGGSDDEVRVVPLVDADGRATSVVNRYPTPISLLATGWRLGRLMPRQGAARRVLAPLLGAWGRDHSALMRTPGGTWPLATHWASGAVLSIATSRLRAVGGFDERFFLYFEDVDLCRRLAARYPAMHICLPNGIAAALHEVGGSSPDASARRASACHHLASARRYAASQGGMAWRFCRALLWPRTAWLEVRTDRSSR